MAPNISLQNLILSANEKRDEVVTKLKQKQEQMLQSKKFDGQATALINEFNNMTMGDLDKSLMPRGSAQDNAAHASQVSEIRA